MCDACAIPVTIPPELVKATEQQVIANATERLNRLRQENETYKNLTAVEGEHTKQAENLLNYEQNRTQLDAEEYQIKADLGTQRNQQLTHQLTFEQSKTQALGEKLKALAGVESQKALQASQQLEFSKLETEFKSQKYLTQAKNWEQELKELELKNCQQEKLFALKHGCK